MVDKIRKFGLWLFNNKERMVLIIMVGVLVYRIYEVFSPKEVEKMPLLRAPKTDIQGVPQEKLPPIPGMRPPLDIPGNYSQLYNSNPFWYYSGNRSSNDGDIKVEDLNIHLLNVRQVGDKWRAQLRTAATREWYDEGDQFEEFELVSIDPQTKTVVVNAKRYRKRFTLELE